MHENEAFSSEPSFVIRNSLISAALTAATIAMLSGTVPIVMPLARPGAAAVGALAPRRPRSRFDRGKPRLLTQDSLAAQANLVWWLDADYLHRYLVAHFELAVYVLYAKLGHL